MPALDNIHRGRSEDGGMEPSGPGARDLPPPVCRRPGCDRPAASGSGFCTEHGLVYVRWRALRDEIERADMEGTGRHPGTDVSDDAGLARALDIMHRFLTRGPFA
jgi:hypothetical protein